MWGGGNVGASFGRLLRGYRLAAGLTQEELAERAGLSIRAVSDMERGRTARPYARSVRLLATALALDDAARGQLITAMTARPGEPGEPGESADSSQARTDRNPGTWPRQLPAAPRNFVGRTAELRLLDSLLGTIAGEASPVVALISGTAGVGKTSLALHWAHQVSDRFPDGQLYVNLRGFGPTGLPVTPAAAIRDFLSAFQVPGERIPTSPDAQEALYRSVLAGKRVLVVADNARDADQIRPLLPAGPGCLVLVTSRGQLTSLVAGQGAFPISLDVLPDAEARELMSRRLGSGRAAGDPAAMARLTGLCARLPLALAVAAARAVARPQQPLSVLADELREEQTRLDALDGGDAAASVRSVLSWSYASLSVPAARMFRLLGVHPGPDISAPAAASLAGVDREAAREALTELVSANLITGDHPGRFGFHDLLRSYAAEQARSLDSAPARRTAIHRALDHYVLTAHAAMRMLNPQTATRTAALSPSPGALPEDVTTYGDAMAWYEAERHVLSAAVQAAVSAGFDVHAWQLPAAMASFVHLRGYWPEYAELHQAGLAAALRLGDPWPQARMHHGLGQAQSLLGSFDDASFHFGLALDLYRQVGDRTAQALLHTNLGGMLDRLGRYRESLAECEDALAIYTELGDRAWQARALNNVGWCHAQLADYRQCLRNVRQAIGLHQEIGDEHGEATAWDSLGYAHHHLGEHDEAVACYEQALQMFRDLGHRFNQADILTHLGDAHAAAGHPDDAQEAWREALEILDDLQHDDADGVRARTTAALPASGAAP
jgi:tetratricopeptide (TPR) repeat protein/transcriptional regulator with XRE-family HTH domain